MILEEKEEGHQHLLKMNFSEISIAGVDEVGKGSLYGPVFAGAIIISKRSEIKLIKKGLKDSKKLTSNQREILVPVIKQESISWSLGQASAREIDKYGIRTATEKAMIRALEKFSSPPKLVIVDGMLPIRLWTGKQKTQIRGESYFPSIAAASVLAKQARDELIQRLAMQFPQYDLHKNKGYGTALHRKRILEEGPTTLHRQSFLSKIIKN